VDTVARGLLNAAKLIEDEVLTSIVKERYAGWSSELGQAMLNGKMTLAEIADGAVADAVAPKAKSGRQELIENIVARYI